MPSPPDDRPALTSVDRARNAHPVRELCGPALDDGWTVALWALGDVVDDLAEFTVGSGPGERLLLLNELLRRTARARGWLVVADDDVTFVRGDVVRLVSLCRRAGLDLGQSARSDPPVDHEVTVARRLSVARRTSFVEIGPVFVVAPRWRDRIVPFPEERGMGWGLEFEWMDLAREGCLLGVVDAVRIRHEGGSAAADYDIAAETDRWYAEIAARGLGGWHEVQTTLATWRPWQRSPQWTRAR